jgi:hypothetical protein
VRRGNFAEFIGASQHVRLEFAVARHLLNMIAKINDDLH